MVRFPNKLTFLEKAKLFVLRDGSATLSRVLVGAVLGILIGSGAGVGTIGLVGVGLVGLTGLSQLAVQNAKEQTLTSMYREEIAAGVGKAPEQVRVSDLRTMSVTPDEGGKGSYAIKAALADNKRVRNFHVAAQAATAVLMTAALGIASLLIAPEISAVVLAGAASLFYNELFSAVRAGGELLYDVKQGTITNDIRQISDQIGLGGRVSSTRVLGVFVKANQELASDIKARFGDDYEALNINTKRELVRDLDAKYDIYKVTQDINFGHVNPTELGFLAYGQKSGVARREDALVPFSSVDGTGESNEICADEGGKIICRDDNPELTTGERITFAARLNMPDTQVAREVVQHAERVQNERMKESGQGLTVG